MQWLLSGYNIIKSMTLLFHWGLVYKLRVITHTKVLQLCFIHCIPHHINTLQLFCARWQLLLPPTLTGYSQLMDESQIKSHSCKEFSMPDMRFEKQHERSPDLNRQFSVISVSARIQSDYLQTTSVWTVKILAVLYLKNKSD